MKKAEFGQLPMPVQDYLLYLEAIKGHSELSVIEYASDLRTFFRYLAKEKNLYPPDTPDDQMDLRGRGKKYERDAEEINVTGK